MENKQEMQNIIIQILSILHCQHPSKKSIIIYSEQYYLFAVAKQSTARWFSAIHPAPAIPSIVRW